MWEGGILFFGSNSTGYMSRSIAHKSTCDTHRVSIPPTSTVKLDSPQIFVDIMFIRIIFDQFLMFDEATLRPKVNKRLFIPR